MAVPAPLDFAAMLCCLRSMCFQAGDAKEGRMAGALFPTHISPRLKCCCCLQDITPTISRNASSQDTKALQLQMAGRPPLHSKDHPGKSTHVDATDNV